MTFIKAKIVDHFGLVMLCAFGLGILIPGGEFVPKWAVPALLGIIIFFACSKITIADLKMIRIRDVLGFYVGRFILLPLVFFGAASYFLPEYRFVLLMLALIPCGATVPAVLEILKGNSSLGLAATTVTSILAPFTIPFAFWLLADMEMELDIWGMFQTLAMIIFLPIILYFPFVRRIEPVKLAMRENTPIISVVLICLTVAILISTYRDYFFHDFGFVLLSSLVGLGGFAFFYISSWILFAGQDLKLRLSYTVMSGNVNIMLGISVAFLYFPENQALMLVMCELPWVATLAGFQMFARHQHRKFAVV